MKKITMHYIQKRYLLTFIAMCFSSIVFAAEWQWSVAVKGGRDKGGPARAFLWIPPQCGEVRAVLVAQHNMEEVSILENPIMRQTLTEMGFAQVWVSPAFDHLFRFNEGAGDTFTGMMHALAEESGYQELKYAPIIALGHSAAASWPYYFAAWNPGRTLAAISVSGQWPYFRSPVFAPDIWGERNIDFVPCLETMGEYESANTWSAKGLKDRQDHPLMPLSMLAAPAEGHFAATDRKVAYLALYIRKAAQYRLLGDAPAGSPPRLKPIDPTRSGWLVDKWRFNQAPSAQPGPVGQYTGDPTQAFWFFDAEMAQATERYQAAYRGLKAQLLGYVQQGKVVAQRNTHQQVDLRFLPQADGITFKLSATFLDTVPGGSPRPAQWTGMPAGSPVGHARGGGPVTIQRISGPFRQLENDVFALHLESGLGAVNQDYSLWFSATHPGDGEYKPAVQQARMVVPLRNTEGAKQQVVFPAIPDQQARKARIKLKATSTAGVPVHYYVLQGPAIITGNSLRLTEVPVKAKYPVRVTVVAWQYGRSMEPKLQSAQPVERTFYIKK